MSFKHQRKWFSIREEAEGWITLREHSAFSWGSYCRITSHFLSPDCLRKNILPGPLSLLPSVVIPLLAFSFVALFCLLRWGWIFLQPALTVFMFSFIWFNIFSLHSPLFQLPCSPSPYLSESLSHQPTFDCSEVNKVSEVSLSLRPRALECFHKEDLREREFRKVE